MMDYRAGYYKLFGEITRALCALKRGCPEAAEHPGRPVLAVQFHPERMSFANRRADTVDGAEIFRWLIAQCGG